jgi:FixJ family two-component response regulator
MALSVAIVDDDRHVRRSLCRLLRAAGIESRGFSSAEEFLSNAGHETADCIVLDIHLGGMSGLELYEQLIARGNAPPTIFITANDISGHSHRVHKTDCIDLLHKPFSGDSLLDAVHRAVRPG